MWFWWFMLICGLIIPIVAVIAGRHMWKHCPKDINKLIGYRSNRSMKNGDTWKFAHEYCGKMWFILGFVMLLPSVGALIPFYNSTYATIGMVVGIITAIQIIVIVVSIILTEFALKKTFFDDGTRR